MVNKVIYGGTVLIDLTGDNVTPEVLLNGVKAHNAAGEAIIGTCPFDVNSTDATALADEVLSGKTIYARGEKITGTMINNGEVIGYISDKNEPFTIPLGFHDGSGKVYINQSESNKLIPSNIREGVTILGVVGTMSGLEGVKAQPKTVTPSITQQVIVPDEGYNYISQVTVLAIPYVETENSSGGVTVSIG